MKGKTMKYMVIIEKDEVGYGAHVPDLPDCIAAGESEEEVRALIEEAIAFHIEGLIEEGKRVPQPSSSSIFVEVQAA